MNRVILALSGILSALLLNIAEIKPNRIASGTSQGVFEFLGIWVYLLLAAWVIVMALSFYKGREGEILTFIAVIFVPIALIFGMVSFADTSVLEGASPRISLSSGFYTQLMLLYLLVSGIEKPKSNLRWLLPIVFAGLVVLVMFIAISGKLDSYSLTKEYLVRRSQFIGHLRTHAILSIGSTFSAAIIAIPLGYLAYRRSSLEGRIMVPLSIIETIPSLSLFGLLLVPLSTLGSFGLFRAIGVSGIGWAPAFVALTLYALLPIARNTLAGFGSLDPAIIDSAIGMGMTKKEILREIELPLAMPVLFTGIRIALVQTVGGAVLAGLVGGGGLGSFVFLGLAEASQDLVLLGVIPIVVITVLVDGGLKRLEDIFRRSVYD